MSSFGSTFQLRAATTLLVFVLGSACAPFEVRHAQAHQPGSGGTPRQGWSIVFAGGRSSPIVTPDALFIGSNDGALHAIDSRTGSIRWRFETGAGLPSGPRVLQVPEGASLWDAITAPSPPRPQINATPVVDAGTVYVGSLDFSFYAIDAVSGQKKWSFATGGEILDAALIHAGVVVVASRDGLLYGLDAQSGEKRWAVYTEPGSRKRHPVGSILHDGTVYVTNWPIPDVAFPENTSSFIHAIESSSGRVKWMKEVGGKNPSPPIHAAGLIIFSTTEGEFWPGKENLVRFHAIDAANGTVKWRHETVYSYASGSNRALWLDGRIIIGTDRIVSGLDTETGAAVWTRRSDRGDEFSDLAGQGNTVLVGTSRSTFWAKGGARGELVALDGSTGTQKWSTRLGTRFGGIDGSIDVEALHGDSAYVSTGRYLQRLELAKGTVVWSHKTDTPISARPLVDDPVIYVASNYEDDYSSKAVEVGHLQALDLRSGKVRP